MSKCREHILSSHGGMPDEALIESRLDPEGADRGGAVVFTLLAWLQIAAFTYMPVGLRISAHLSRVSNGGVWAYLVAAGCFLPIAVRRRHPAIVLAVVSAFALLYTSMSWPPTIVIVGPMLALYTASSRYGGRRTLPFAVLLVGMFVGVSALTVSTSRAVAQAVGIFALLGLSAAIGHGARTRRELVREVVRTRKEEARRRLEEERLSIAREVHDIMAHSLTLMTVQADAGLAVFDERPERSREALGVIGETGRDTLRDLRSMLDVLTSGESASPRTPVVADLRGLDGLVDSVREAGFAASLETLGDLGSVPTAIAVSTYRIVQESLTNVVRHSGARAVSVRVAVTPSEVEVSVTDDGTGSAEGGTSGGRGIQGMSERVVALGGTLSAGPAAKGGFRVSARIPLPRSA